MSNTKLFLAALLAGASLAAPAFAQQDYRAQSDYGAYGGGGYAPYNDGGLGRYCPPGQYPHSWTGGTGIRCEPVGGTTEFHYPN